MSLLCIHTLLGWSTDNYYLPSTTASIFFLPKDECLKQIFECINKCPKETCKVLLKHVKFGHMTISLHMQITTFNVFMVYAFCIWFYIY